MHKEFYDLINRNVLGDKASVTGIAYVIFCDHFMGIIIEKIQTWDPGETWEGIAR